MRFQRTIMGIAGFAIVAITCSAVYMKQHAHIATDGLQYRFMFYNVENFFDIVDDSASVDEAFTPAGDMHWTYSRYANKLRNIYKVIIAAGGWRPPDIIGFCEIENRQVLLDLIGNTPLSKFAYRIVHKNSPDRRGIDVALIYNSQTVRYVYSKFYSIDKPGLLTRDILYCKVLLEKDTCHIFVNHWPSRSAGQLETEPDRFAAARLLKQVTDSLFTNQPSAKIIIMGDFNDEPSDKSLDYCLKANRDLKSPFPLGLYNLTVAPSSVMVRGTLRYQGQWNLFDQIIVSGAMLSDQETLTVEPKGYRIFDASFLLAIDEQYNGYKPYRTYSGFSYKGGFSDHLPVYVDLISR
jgi:predicted extracellular nuclease